MTAISKAKTMSISTPAKKVIAKHAATKAVVSKKVLSMSELKAAEEKAHKAVKIAQKAILDEENRLFTTARHVTTAKIIANVEKTQGFWIDKPKEKIALSEKDKAIVNAVKGGAWGCQTNNVHKLVEALTGIKAEIFKTPKQIDPLLKTCKIGQFLVPTVNKNGHDYLLGEVVFVTRSDSAGHAQGLSEKHNTSIGNNLKIDDSGLRRASKEEIATFLKAIGVDLFKAIIKTLDI